MNIKTINVMIIYVLHSFFAHAMEDVVVQIIEDGHEIKLDGFNALMPLASAKLSDFLKNMIDDVGMNEPMPLHLHSPELFFEIVPLWNILTQITQDNPGLDIEGKLQLQIKSLENELNYSFNYLYSLMELANYLGIEPLLHALCSAFANKIEKLGNIYALSIKEFIANESFADISQVIAHYIVKNNNILGNACRDFNNEKIILDTFKHDFSDMLCASINDKGDVAWCIQLDPSYAWLSLHSSKNKRNKNSHIAKILPFMADANAPNSRPACALTSEGDLAACIGKREKTVEISIVDFKTQKIKNIPRPELNLYPLLATFSSDDTKLCVASGTNIYIYEVNKLRDDSTIEPYKIDAPSGAIQDFFAHDYDKKSYLIIKHKEVNSHYLMLDINNPNQWVEKTNLERFFDFNLLAQNLSKNVKDFFKESNTNTTLVPVFPAFNFYTYKICVFFPQKNNLVLINTIPDQLVNVIKLFNKQINFADALYLLAIKINNWHASRTSEFILSSHLAKNVSPEVRAIDFKSCVKPLKLQNLKYAGKLNLYRRSGHDYDVLVSQAGITCALLGILPIGHPSYGVVCALLNTYMHFDMKQIENVGFADPTLNLKGLSYEKLRILFCVLPILVAFFEYII